MADARLRVLRLLRLLMTRAPNAWSVESDFSCESGFELS